MNPGQLYTCFINAMVQRCSYVAGGTVAMTPGLVTAFTNLYPASSFCFFTSAPESTTDTESRVVEALDRGHRSLAPWSLGTRGDWLRDDDGFLNTLTARGFVHHAIVYGMWADQLLAARRPVPTIDFRRVTNERELSAFAAINNVAHGFDVSAGTAIYEHYLRAPGSHAFVGFIDNEPVSSAAAFPTAQGVYLGGVATVTEYRGRGYGEAASRCALGAATEKPGTNRAILFASKQRAPFYEQLGFAIGAELWLFRQPPR